MQREKIDITTREKAQTKVQCRELFKCIALMHGSNNNNDNSFSPCRMRYERCITIIIVIIIIALFLY